MDINQSVSMETVSMTLSENQSSKGVPMKYHGNVLIDVYKNLIHCNDGSACAEAL